MNKKIQLETCMHRRVDIILFHFEKDLELLSILKKTIKIRWSATHTSWYCLKSEFQIGDFLKTMKGIAWIDCSKLKIIRNNSRSERFEDQPIKQAKWNEMEAGIEKFKIWMKHKRYSENTIKTYSEAIRQFLKYNIEKGNQTLDNELVVEFMHDYIIKKELSFSYQNQIINAIKLYFREIEKSDIKIDKLQRPRKEYKLPNILSKEEVKLILEAPTNIKHKTMLSLIYACGLRRSELLNLKPEHIDSNRKLLIIRNAKGRKDRIAPISDKLIYMLRDYYKIFRPVKWLFEGQKSGEKYSEQSLQSVLKQSLRKRRITKPVTLHWLRHSYATHLLESGTDLRYIQELLGHKSSKTTEIYTHVSTKNIQKIRTPFDDL